MPKIWTSRDGWVYERNSCNQRPLFLSDGLLTRYSRPEDVPWQFNINANRTLSTGASPNYDIMWLQLVLKKIGSAYHRENEPNYSNILDPAGGADGYFGNATANAVKAFQGHHLSGYLTPLGVNGVVDTLTWGAVEWWNRNPSGYGGHNDYYDSIRPPAVSEGPVRFQFPQSGDATQYLTQVLQVDGRFAQFHYHNVNWFMYMVKSWSHWDLKRSASAGIGPHTQTDPFLKFYGTKISPDQFGNIHFGFVGRALGLELSALIGGSSVFAIGDNGPKLKTIVKEFGDWPAIRRGFNLRLSPAWVKGITYYTM